MKSPYDIILRPVLTEKAYNGIEQHKYTFEVDLHANKIEIKQAVEQIFGVTVRSVTTLRRIGKVKRMGRFSGRRPTVKKACVRLTDDSKTIEFFEGMA